MKTQELRELSIDELSKKAADLRMELLKNRLERANHQNKNPLKLRHLRRNIAKILTVISEKKGAN